MKKQIPADQAILTVYGGEKLILNGKSFKDYPHTGGGLLSGYITKFTLVPGDYEIVGTYSTTSAAGKMNNKLKNASLKVSLRGGHEYDLGIHTDPGELEIAVAHLPLDKSGWNLICRMLED